MKRLALFLIPLCLFACDFHDFDPYQNKFTAQEIREKIRRTLEKDPNIQKFFHLTPETLTIGKKGAPDYVLSLAARPSLQSEESTKGLKGLRVALDPGHLGGKYAELEKRCIKVLGAHLHEGDMAYLTAVRLKELLENEGAIVLITRPGLGQGVLAESFDTWQLRDKVSSQKKLFIRYNRADLYARADKINAFNPDITLILHYNSEYSADDETIPLIDENYAMVFVPGAFSENELDRERDRYEFLRLLLTNGIEESVSLSQKIAEHFENDLKVPLVKEVNLPPKLRPYCLFQKPGVYSRNLALTRLIHSPVCYGEPLLQNHKKEAQFLVEQNTSIQGVSCSKRLEQVAQAYFAGIKDYCRGREKITQS